MFDAAERLLVCNRRYLEMCATQSGEPFALLAVDLDRFKEVNDVFGHSAGDALLWEMAARLKNAADGAFVARLGGDELTLICEAAPQTATAEILAARLQAAVADAIEIADHQTRIGLSIGVALFPTDGADAANAAEQCRHRTLSDQSRRPRNSAFLRGRYGQQVT
jgi:diguanylate cyclase (GGDEF)-like protein